MIVGAGARRVTLAGSLKHTIGSEVKARSHTVHGKTSNHLCVCVCVSEIKGRQRTMENTDVQL